MALEDIREAHWWAGIALALSVAIAAGYAADFVGVSLLGFSKSPISAIMMAIVIGMVIANVVVLPESVITGLRFCTSTVLRVGIMLLGIRLSLVSAGMNALLAVPFVMVAIAVGLTTVGVLGRSTGYSSVNRSINSPAVVPDGISISISPCLIRLYFSDVSKR